MIFNTIRIKNKQDVRLLSLHGFLPFGKWSQLIGKSVNLVQTMLFMEQPSTTDQKQKVLDGNRIIAEFMEDKVPVSVPFGYGGEFVGWFNQQPKP